MDSSDVVDFWADRSGAYSPAYYAYRGPDEATESVLAAVEERVGPDSRTLEVGCSSGRHLASLHANGYTDLHGVDVNTDAFEVMADTYPELCEVGTFYHDPIESVVTGFADGQFDAVYTVETLQHLPPSSEWVFEELARITDGLLVTVENEGDRPGTAAGFTTSYVDGEVPLYHRNWGRVFAELGLVEVDARPVDHDTFRVFRTSRRPRERDRRP